MASASQSFPTRPFSNTLHGKLPERGGGGGGGFGLSTAGRGNQQSQQQQSGINNRGDIVGGVSNSGGNASNITDEQREEINEAVRVVPLFGAYVCRMRAQQRCLRAKISQYMTNYSTVCPLRSG